jgi:ABC-2 type transport system ATP-binding protein
MAIIEVKNLTKTYNGFKAVDNITFSIAPGEIFAFLGPNGAGKSTTIKMLTTLLHPDSGELSINHYNVLKQKDLVRKSFGIVFQDPSLDDELTAYENMYFHAMLYKVPREKIKPRIQELLEFVELWDRKNDLVKKFSGGMKRRLEIARGFLHHPKVLFLDEPTLGLDPQTRNHIWDYVKNLNKKEGTTVFFTTHYMIEAERVADQIAIIDQGKIITQGTLEQLKTQTKTDNLEDAFLKLTGYKIREEAAQSAANLRLRSRVWGRR